MTIVLPNYTRRAWLRSFWLTMSLGLGVLTGLVLWDLSLAQRMTVGLAVAAIAAAPGFLRPRIAILPLRMWNKLARLVASVGTVWLTGVCFHIVFTAMGWVGSSLRLDHPAAGDSLWTPWQHDAAGGREAAEGIALARSSARGWAGDFADWARRSHNTWAWSLLPFLFILATFETTRDVEAPPPGIYTLY